MVRIRLARLGAKKRPFYRIVVSDSRTRRNGRVVETLGTYDPLQEPSAVNLDVKKAEEWIKKGAQPSETVKKILKKAAA